MASHVPAVNTESKIEAAPDRTYSQLSETPVFSQSTTCARCANVELRSTSSEPEGSTSPPRALPSSAHDHQHAAITTTSIPGRLDGLKPTTVLLSADDSMIEPEAISRDNITPLQDQIIKTVEGSPVHPDTSVDSDPIFHRDSVPLGSIPNTPVDQKISTPVPEPATGMHYPTASVSTRTTNRRSRARRNWRKVMQLLPWTTDVATSGDSVNETEQEPTAEVGSPDSDFCYTHCEWNFKWN